LGKIEKRDFEQDTFGNEGVYMAWTDDRLTLWIASGIIGSVVREVFDLVIVWMGLPLIHISFLAADLFTNHIYQMNSWAGLLTGTLTDWILGSIFGVIIGLVLQWSGRQNYLLKGIGIGLISWVGIFGFLVEGMAHMFIIKPTIWNTLFAIVPHIIYGGITAFCIVRFTKIPSR
jgi:hypothetical protein